MTRSSGREMESAAPAVGELLARRGQLLGWLARLEEVRDGENERVVDRVRSDYEARLKGVVTELSEHLESLRAELDRALERRRLAEEQHAEADEALHEARLRHRIGELAPDAWAARRRRLEEEVERTASERDALAAEVSRLEEVVSQIDSGVLAPPAPGVDAEATVPEGPALRSAAATAALPEPAVGESSVAAPPDETVLEPEPADQDLAFLEELDRAIAGSAGAVELEAEPEVDTRPPKGAKCPECGYTNDADAWYCGVCGIDLA